MEPGSGADFGLMQFRGRGFLLRRKRHGRDSNDDLLPWNE